MHRVKALPLHSSPACRTLFKEDLSTKYWLNEVSQRHISKSEIETSTLTESQVSLAKNPIHVTKPDKLKTFLCSMSITKNEVEQSLRSARFANPLFIKHVLES